MSREEIERIADTMDRLSGGVSDADVSMGNSLTCLQAYFKAGMEGIEREVSKPILAALEAHFDQVRTAMEKAFDAIKGAIPDLIAGWKEPPSPWACWHWSACRRWRRPPHPPYRGWWRWRSRWRFRWRR